ncbi:MAG: recombination regulator RecX [Burkholderiaceae bacterium]
MGGGLSLKARAISLLSRREHSRSELRRKLAAHCEDAAELEQLFGWLEAGGWLSQERFAESIVHRRASRHGVRRIMHELRQHELPEDIIADVADQLRSTEFERARAVWAKRFDAPPADAKEYARQARYLAARGFSHDCLRRILADGGLNPEDEPPPSDDPC